MLALAIIGIIATIMIPAYQDYGYIENNRIPLPLTSLAVVDGVEQELIIGRVVIGSPKIIKEDEAKSVQVVLDVNRELMELFTLLPDEYNKHGADVKVSNRMQATLKSHSFDITASSPEIQAVGSTDPVRWSWMIKAKSKAEGKSKLTFSLSALVPVQGQSTPKVLESYTRYVFIDISIMSKTWTFLQENMGWLWAPFVLVGGLIGTRVFRKKDIPE